MSTLVEYTTVDWSALKPWPEKPFHFTHNMHDIPNTMAAAIRNAPPLCRKVNVVLGHPMHKLHDVIKAAEEKGIEINWIPLKSLGTE